MKKTPALTLRRLRPLLLIPASGVLVQVLSLLSLLFLFFQLTVSRTSWICWQCSALFAVVVSKPRAQHYGQQQRLRCRSPFLVFSASSSDDVQMDADPRKEFLEAMERFKFATQESDDGDIQKQQRNPQQHDPLMGYRPEQLEAYAESLMSGSAQRSPQSLQDNDATTRNNNSDSTLRLNDDLYIRSRDYHNQDDSIRQQRTDLDNDRTDATEETNLNDSTIMDQKCREAMQNYLEMVVTNQAPEAYDSVSDTATSASTVEDLWTFLGQHGVPTYDPVAAETLHQQVFVEEEGHLQQSEAFRASLIDSTAAQQVAAERRGRNYRERQEEVIRELDQQIREFEATTLPKLRPFPPSLPAVGRARQHPQSSNRGDDDVYAELHASFSSRMKFPRLGTKSHSLKAASVSSSLQLQQQQHQHQQRRHPFASVPSSAIRANSTMPPALPQQRPDSGSVTGSSNSKKIETPPVTLAASHTSQGRGPWRAVEDPDTNEIFYWNEETEEMRWGPLEELTD